MAALDAAEVMRRERMAAIRAAGVSSYLEWRALPPERRGAWLAPVFVIVDEAAGLLRDDKGLPQAERQQREHARNVHRLLAERAAGAGMHLVTLVQQGYAATVGEGLRENHLARIGLGHAKSVRQSEMALGEGVDALHTQIGEGDPPGRAYAVLGAEQALVQCYWLDSDQPAFDQLLPAERRRDPVCTGCGAADALAVGWTQDGQMVLHCLGCRTDRPQNEADQPQRADSPAADADPAAGTKPRATPAADQDASSQRAEQAAALACGWCGADHLALTPIRLGETALVACEVCAVLLQRGVRDPGASGVLLPDQPRPEAPADDRPSAPVAAQPPASPASAPAATAARPSGGSRRRRTS